LSPGAAAPGLYSNDGKRLLVALSRHDSVSAKVFGQECTLVMEDGGEALRITRWRGTSNRDDRCRNTVLDRANELDNRKRDVAGLEQQMAAKTAEMRRDFKHVHEELQQELGELNRLIGLHEEKIRELMATADIYPYDVKQMLELGEHCSMAERRADEATRDVVTWLKCEYMNDHIGSEFSGTVSAVTNFGLFVQLDDIYVDGLVHISSLQSDYYQYEQSAHRLVGDRTRIVYSLGDKLQIRVVRVSLDDRKIDFELAEGGVTKPDRGRKGSTQRKPAKRQESSADGSDQGKKASADGKPKKRSGSRSGGRKR
jgi:predicted RNA-binding protein with RPS1 domain